MKYEYILKAIEQELQKCTVTLKSIRKQISPIIKNITDSEEEYETLMNTISYWYRDHWNSEKEYLQYLTYDGKSYETSGKENIVDVTDEMQEHKGEYLLSIHNHPNGSCLQSQGDIDTQATLTLEKYGITIGKDGVIINKNTDFNIDNSYGGFAEKWTNEILIKEFEQTSQFKALEEKFNKRDKVTDHDAIIKNIEEYEDEYCTLLGDYIVKQNNTGKWVELLNENYAYATSNGFPVSFEATYIPIKRN